MDDGFARDGTLKEYDWEGFIAKSEKPSLFNPSKGFISTANNMVASNHMKLQ
jgi:acyl-homoserine lactone acylase PvdQ